jgi:hypothetical protein
MDFVTWLARYGRTFSMPELRWNIGRQKIRRLRQYLRGWAKNTSGAYKKEKS